MAETVLKDDEYYKGIRETFAEERESFISEMNKIDGVTAFKSDTNFVYVKIKDKDVREVQEKLKNQGYLIRIFNYNDCYCLRVTLFSREVMDVVIRAFRECA